MAQISNLPSVGPQVTISAVDQNRDGSVDLVAIQQHVGDGVTRTGIYNVQTDAGRAAVRQTLLDLGLGAEFLTAVDSAFINAMSPEGRGALNGFGTAIAGMMSSGVAPTTGLQDIQARWAEFVTKNNVTSGGDVNALVQAVLREAYLENTQDLAFYAQKVRFYNELKKNMRDELTKARAFLSRQAGRDGASSLVGTYANSAGTSSALTFPTEPGFAGGNMVALAPRNDPSTPLQTKDNLETYIKGLEEKLNSVGDDAQLANVDLQNMLQKQQQTLQMMSNISKMLHDTAMAIIRKIGS